MNEEHFLQYVLFMRTRKFRGLSFPNLALLNDLQLLEVSLLRDP